MEPEGTVARVQEQGVVVDLGDDIEGFVPVSHSGVDDPSRLEEHYGAGDAVSLRVIESDAANRRIVLEVSEVPPRKSKEEIEEARIRAAEAAAEAAAKASAAEADDDDEFVKPKATKTSVDSSEGLPSAAATAPKAGEEEGEGEAEGDAPQAEAASDEADTASDDEADTASDDEARRRTERPACRERLPAGVVDEGRVPERPDASRVRAFPCRPVPRGVSDRRGTRRAVVGRR